MSAAMQLHRQKKMAAGLTRDIKLDALNLSFHLAEEIAEEISLKCVAIHLSVASQWKQFLLKLTEQYFWWMKRHVSCLAADIYRGRHRSTPHKQTNWQGPRLDQVMG